MVIGRGILVILSTVAACLLSIIASTVAQDFGPATACRLRCTAACVEGGKTLSECTSQCASVTTCGNQTKSGISGSQKPPEDFAVTFGDDASIRLDWEYKATPPASLFVVQWKTDSDTTWSDDRIVTTTTVSLHDWKNPTGSVCTSLQVRVAPVMSGDTSGSFLFSTVLDVPTPQPYVPTALTLDAMTFSSTPFESDLYHSNGTVEVRLRWATSLWPLGSDDLIVTPLFHMVNCEQPDLSQAVPVPTFNAAPNDSQALVGKLGADVMYRQCRFVTYISQVESKQCQSSWTQNSPGPTDFVTVAVNCDTVLNNDCKRPQEHHSPLCGQVGQVNFSLVGDPGAYDSNDKLTLNMSFVPLERQNMEPTLYYTALFGPAQKYNTSDEEAFLGVNLTKVTGNATTCRRLVADGRCANSTGTWMLLSDVQWNQLYGVVICAIKEPGFLEYPSFTGDLAVRPRAVRLYMDLKLYEHSRGQLIIGLTVGVGTMLLICLLCCCYLANRRQRRQNRVYQMKLEQLEAEKAAASAAPRYVDLPREPPSSDEWELERRQLVIHHDKKLGSGAFGAVYLGRLVGKSTVPAGERQRVNLARVENENVAVKMLPEYADDLSKSDFLREIGLMKRLGYHERLVNMIACVTETEPYALVVEYCSDGDLLTFLRTRCDYMLKLDEEGVDYSKLTGTNADQIDLSMILTLKQLLSYGLQVSLGLEYLSSKGFVHRDVAARNVLVHEKTTVKIGDFGLCRYVYSQQANYKCKGGRLPLKWMAPEAIRHYEFSTKSDVWSLGVLLFEIITLGGSPWPGVQPEDMLTVLDSGRLMTRPDNCPDELYAVMCACWARVPQSRPDFGAIKQRLASQLETITEEYAYLRLDATKDYYNAPYKEPGEERDQRDDANDRRSNSAGESDCESER